VEIEPTKIEGMIPYRTIRSDFFIFDEDHYRAVGRRTHRSIRLGDALRIRVKGTSLEQKLLDYELVEDLPDIPEVSEEPENPEADMERAMARKERRPRRKRNK
jgi:hypothetical protein